jgi:hypothetical protein
LPITDKLHTVLSDLWSQKTGVRGVAVADVIRRLRASSQLDDEVSALFPPAPARVLG